MNHSITLDQEVVSRPTHVISVVQYEYQNEIFTFALDLGLKLDCEKFIRKMRWAALHGVTVKITSSGL